jgi:outer membrane protein OmpA-like peptidoglycan-associated protein
MGVQAAGDVSGGRDHPELGRIPGAVLKEFRHEQYGTIRFPLESKRYRFTRMGKSEGETWRLVYGLPSGMGPDGAFSVYRKKLQEMGFDLLYECEDENHLFYRNLIKSAKYPSWQHHVDSVYCLVARGKLRGRKAIVGIYPASSRGRHAGVWMYIVESKPLEAKLEVVGAEKMASEISSKGRIALYGILFDHDSAAIKPESKPTLAEIAKYLRAHSKAKLYVVGHTDNTGTYEYNLDLSKRRAASVVKALVRNHGVAAGRLKAVGVGPVAPVASNETEEGRAKNRRVELVAQ